LIQNQIKQLEQQLTQRPELLEKLQQARSPKQSVCLKALEQALQVYLKKKKNPSGVFFNPTPKHLAGAGGRKGQRSRTQTAKRLESSCGSEFLFHLNRSRKAMGSEHERQKYLNRATAPNFFFA